MTMMQRTAVVMVVGLALISSGLWAQDVMRITRKDNSVIDIPVSEIESVTFTQGAQTVPSDALQDADGNVYKTVRIGDQVWMAENLNYDTTGSFCYNDSAYYSEIYGRLYSWETATGACPEGWRLPSDIDWQELETCLGMNPDEVRMDFWRGEDEGARLKSKQGWNGNGNGTDNYGLSILPSGYRGIYGKYGLVGDYGYCWTSTGFSDKSAWYRRFGAGRNQILRYTNNKEQGYPVRCLKVE